MSHLGNPLAPVVTSPEHSGGRDVSQQDRATLVGSHVEDDVGLVLRVSFWIFRVQCSVLDVQFWVFSFWYSVFSVQLWVFSRLLHSQHLDGF